MVRHTVVVLIVLSLAAPAVYAQEPVTAPNPSVINIRASIEKIRFDESKTAARQTAEQARFQQQKHVSTATKIGVGVAGALLGYLGGGLLGASIQPPCHCDDPGLAGFVIGAPIGAVLGAIAAIKLASR